jgi:2-C-methyl-D-erythritol 2,4-cyclodiphosphate synthase
VAAVEADAGATRTGFASDVHAFGPGDGLWLGGVEIPAAPRLHGHSDGDAALHAIGGALLGAAGLGDLGTVYPADERTRRGIPSSELVEGIVRRLDEAGWRPLAIDLLISAGRPRIGPSMPAMRERIAAILGVPASDVNVKASTGNLSGDVGAGRVISAQAFATVARTDRAPEGGP